MFGICFALCFFAIFLPLVTFVQQALSVRSRVLLTPNTKLSSICGIIRGADLGNFKFYLTLVLILSLPHCPPQCLRASMIFP